MVQRGEFSKDGKKGSPPAGTHPKLSLSGPSGHTPPPQPPPPPPPHGGHAHYYSYPNPPHPPAYEHMPPSENGHRAPGPYTTAQYDARNTGMALPAYHSQAPHLVRSGSSGSPPSSMNHGSRDGPPQHYPSMHGPAADRPGYAPYSRDELRQPHWPPVAESYVQGPPRFYDSSQSHKFNKKYPPPPPPPPPPASMEPESFRAITGKPASVTTNTSIGPYRYSDPTLRREAVARLKSPETPTDVDGREGATSPSQIETSHREEVTTMGCTCKKTKCLKLYCQCFAVKIYCGGNCRCLICHNTSQCEGERKDAIRNILSRNPNAFDTKFQKSIPDKSLTELAHKLGCKCRKSSCMKKYCECYAGNVKCSPNCRCVGCKNMPRGGFGPDASPGSRVVASSDVDEENLSAKKREPYMMNAAHNLAFLKHASPAIDRAVAPRRTLSTDTGDVGSMPSLASEESPAEKRLGDRSTVSAIGASVMPEPNTAEKTAVNALLMAAMAMAEMSGHQPTTDTSSPPSSSTIVKSEGGGDAYETPQKNLLRQFQSPKRKNNDPRAEANPQDTANCYPQDFSTVSGQKGRCKEESSSSSTSDEESPKREHPGDDTPCQRQKVKRSRIGSLKKGSRNNLDNERTDDIKKPGSCKNVVMETPKTKDGKTTELTPVSARCIDFRKMHVN